MQPELATVARLPRSAPANWEQGLTCSTNGRSGEVKYAATAKNLALILKNDRPWFGVLGYDERGERVTCLSKPPFQSAEREVFPREWRGEDDTRASIWLEDSRFRIFTGPRSDVVRAAVDLVARSNAYDPVRDYLDGLTWDGTERLPRFCRDYFGAPDTPLNAAIGTKWPISAVARAYRPGCQVDHVLVLVGEQGRGKSTGLRALAGEEFFGDNVGDLQNKDSMQNLAGLWIIELAELEALKRSDLATVKAFVTRKEDRYRASYGTRTETHPRRIVFAASTNEEAFLKDSTGNRRWWPVTVNQVDVEGIRRDRDQLWAEAVHRFKAGEPWHLTDANLIREAQAAQEERYQSDAWEGAVLAHLESLPLTSRVTSVREILEGPLGIDLGRHGQVEQNRVAAVLRRHGWEKKQRRSGTANQPNAREYVYVPKEPA